MSDILLYNTERICIGLLQFVESVQWLEDYQAPGEVKIIALATEENISMLVDGNRVYNTDSDTVARICYVDIEQTESGATIVARADIVSELLSDRVVMATETVTGVEAGMYSIYSKNRRDLPIAVGASEGYTETTDTEISWNSVLDAEITLAEASGLGFKVIFDPDTGMETFKVYRGVDRSDDSSENYIGYFGTDVANIQNVVVSTGTTEYKNVAVVAGEGEGAQREVRTVSIGSVAGEGRREMYVDARGLRREYQVATPTGEVDSRGNPIYSYETKTYTEAEYTAILETRGMEKLAEKLKTLSITCDVLQNTIQFGVDYNLGDLMPIKLPEYGIFATARVGAVTRIYESAGNRVSVQLREFTIRG